MSEFRYVPPSHEIADSLLALAQDIEIGKGRVSVVTPPFLREAADRVSRQHAEIERLRAALRDVMKELDDNEEAAAYAAAREALGEDE
jgi:hypothetical protein